MSVSSLYCSAWSLNKFSLDSWTINTESSDTWMSPGKALPKWTGLKRRVCVTMNQVPSVASSLSTRPPLVLLLWFTDWLVYCSLLKGWREQSIWLSEYLRFTWYYNSIDSKSSFECCTLGSADLMLYVFLTSRITAIGEILTVTGAFIPRCEDRTGIFGTTSFKRSLQQGTQVWGNDSVKIQGSVFFTLMRKFNRTIFSYTVIEPHHLCSNDIPI